MQMHETVVGKKTRDKKTWKIMEDMILKNNDFLFFSGILVFFLFIFSLSLKGFVNLFQIKFVNKHILV